MLDSPWVAELAKLAASLGAVLFAVWLAGRWQLGGEARIADADHAIRLADEAEDGFDGTEVALDRARFAAIVRNAEGRQMLIRAHGAAFAAREIDGQVVGRLDKQRLQLMMPDRRFGTVTLELGTDAGRWAARMREFSRHKAS